MGDWSIPHEPSLDRDCRGHDSPLDDALGTSLLLKPLRYSDVHSAQVLDLRRSTYSGTSARKGNLAGRRVEDVPVLQNSFDFRLSIIDNTSRSSHLTICRLLVCRLRSSHGVPSAPAFPRSSSTFLP